MTQLDVREGDWVKAGQVLVVQDDAILRHQYQLSVAEVRAARARLDKMIAGNRPEEIAQAEAQVAQAKALADRVRAEVESTADPSPEPLGGGIQPLVSFSPCDYRKLLTYYSFVI